MRKIALLSLLFIILLNSCTVTTSKTKDPSFTDIKKLQTELTALIKAENINVSGKEITSNNKTTSELEIAITNGTDIPAKDEQREALGKTIASSVKRNLKNQNDYDTYRVVFVKKVEDGMITSTTSIGNAFSSIDL